MSSLGNGLFAVQQFSDKLVLKKRPDAAWGIALPQAVGSTLFLGIYLGGLVPRNDWTFALSVLVLLSWLPYAREIIRIVRGDIWVIHEALNYLEHNGTSVAALDSLACIRIEDTNPDDAFRTYRLMLVSGTGSMFLLAPYGKLDELTHIADLIASRTRLPVIIDK